MSKEVHNGLVEQLEKLRTEVASVHGSADLASAVILEAQYMNVGDVSKFDAGDSMLHVERTAEGFSSKLYPKISPTVI